MERPVFIEFKAASAAGRLEQFREETTLLLTPQIERFLTRSACSLVTIPTEPSQLETGYL
jgi:hypothetical protein